MNENFLTPVKILSAGDMSADITTDPVKIMGLDNVALQANWTGGSSPVGTVIIQGSLDYHQAGESANWVDITLSATLSVSGSSGSVMANMSALAFPWIRLFYDRTSGSGSLEVWVSGKES